MAWTDCIDDQVLKCGWLQGEGTPLYRVMACLLDIKKRAAKTGASFGPLQDTVQSLSNDKNHADHNDRGEHCGKHEMGSASCKLSLEPLSLASCKQVHVRCRWRCCSATISA